MSPLPKSHSESKGVGLEESRDDVAEEDDGEKLDIDRFRFNAILVDKKKIRDTNGGSRLTLARS